MQYPQIVEQLIERLQNLENLELEFKDCRGGLSSDLWETVCAFANTKGGWLLLGVDRNGTPVGFDESHAHNLRKQLFDLGRNRNKINRDVFKESDIEVERIDSTDKFIIILRIITVPRTGKPVYINGNPITGTFIRRHESDYRCNEEEVKRMFRDASSDSIDTGA